MFTRTFITCLLLSLGLPVGASEPCIELQEGHQCFVVKEGREIPTSLCELPALTWKGTYSFWVITGEGEDDMELWLLEQVTDEEINSYQWEFTVRWYKDPQKALASWKHGAVICRKVKGTS